MKKHLILILTLLFTISLLTVGSLPVAGQETKETASPTTTEETQVDDQEEELSPAERILAEIKESLEDQLQPMPELGKKEKIGVLIISVTNPFWANMQVRYEEAGADLGLEVEVLAGTTEGDTHSQLDALLTMATKDYDAIILSPIEGSNLIPGILQCNQNGIPVINLGPGVDLEALEDAGGYLDGKITVEFEEQGRLVAEDMMARLPQGGQVAILQGLSGAAQSEGRTKGAQEAFAENEEMELVAVQPCDWDATLAYEATKDLLVAHPDLQGLFACNDVMALAAMEALKAEGRQEVLVYGIDFTADAQASIEQGEMMGSVTYSSAIYTRAALLLAMKIAQGQEITEAVYSPLTLVTQDNIEDFDGWK